MLVTSKPQLEIKVMSNKERKSLNRRKEISIISLIYMSLVYLLRTRFHYPKRGTRVIRKKEESRTRDPASAGKE